MSVSTIKTNSIKSQRSIFTATPAAEKQIKSLIDNRGKESAGIKVGVNNKGCSGLSYVLEYADTQESGSEIVDINGIKIFIDAKAILYIIGTELDYVEDIMQSGFVFKNPNAKSVCGCQKSFSI